LRRAVPCLLGTLLGCASGDVFVPAEWPADHVAIAVVTDASGTPLTAPVMSSLGQAIDFDFEADGPYRIFVRTYAMTERAPNGMPIGDCPVVLGGDGPLVPAPLTAWRTAPVEPGTPVPGLERVTGELVELDLRYGGCLPKERGCGGFAARELEVPAGLRPYQVAAVSDALAMVGGDIHPGPGREMMLAKIESGTVRVLDPHPERLDFVQALAWDGDIFYARNGEDLLVAFDIDGDPVALPESRTIIGVAAGPDGTVLAFDDMRVTELLSRGQIFVERTDVPQGVLGMSIARADRTIALIGDSAVFYDGRMWTPELDAALFESLNAVFADEDTIGAVGNREQVYVRDPITRAWRDLPIPFDVGADFKAVTGLGDGRFVAVGKGGAIAAWTGTQWCDLSILDRAVGAFRSVSAAPSGRIAWTVASSDGDADPAIIEITVPAPDFP
jgi:hypothetical protein